MANLVLCAVYAYLAYTHFIEVGILQYFMP